MYIIIPSKKDEIQQYRLSKMCTYMYGRDDTYREFQYTIP